MSHLVLRKRQLWRTPRFQGRVLGASLRSVPPMRSGQDIQTRWRGGGGSAWGVTVAQASKRLLFSKSQQELAYNPCY